MIFCLRCGVRTAGVRGPIIALLAHYQMAHPEAPREGSFVRE